VSATMTPQDVLYCLSSLTDNSSFLNSNAAPVSKMIQYLTQYFDPNVEDRRYSLAIKAGINGARLSHSHKYQCNYVLQSLMLWKEIMQNFFKLWILAEEDLLSSTIPYRLTNTGQGLNRVQMAPKVGRAMQDILDKVRSQVGTWHGSSVVHLGDNNVPNAFMFIDKYTQVPRILIPIVSTLEAIDNLGKDDRTRIFIEDTFGGVQTLKMDILTDFFKHAFDGSGGNNYFDAGSCIDGRLTSAWNWCSKLEKKSYFPVFLLTGFVGFDGKFQK